jgi:hypothetical protein
MHEEIPASRLETQTRIQEARLRSNTKSVAVVQITEQK